MPSALIDPKHIGKGGKEQSSYCRAGAFVQFGTKPAFVFVILLETVQVLFDLLSLLPLLNAVFSSLCLFLQEHARGLHAR